MNRILSTTAITAMLLGAPALAQQEGGETPSGQGASASGDIFAQVPSNAELQLGSEMMGSAIYSTEAAAQQASESSSEGEVSDSDTSSESGSSESGPERQQIGQISDIVVTQDGQIDYVVIGVGGFLGIGERNVAVNMDAIEFVQDPESEGAFLMTIPATQDDIENAPEFDPASLRAGSEGGAASEDGSGTEQSSMEGAESEAEQAAQEAGQEAQEAGQAAEDAAQEAGQEAQEAGQAAEDAAQNAGQEVQDAAQQAEQAAEDAAQQAEQAAEQAGQEVQEETSGN